MIDGKRGGVSYSFTVRSSEWRQIRLVKAEIGILDPYISNFKQMEFRKRMVVYVDEKRNCLKIFEERQILVCFSFAEKHDQSSAIVFFKDLLA